MYIFETDRVKIWSQLEFGEIEAIEKGRVMKAFGFEDIFHYIQEIVLPVEVKVYSYSLMDFVTRNINVVAKLNYTTGAVTYNIDDEFSTTESGNIVLSPNASVKTEAFASFIKDNVDQLDQVMYTYFDREDEAWNTSEFWALKTY